MKWDKDTLEVKPWRNKIDQLSRCRMAVVIPSMGRADTLRTLDVWPKQWLPFTQLAVPEAEAEEYRAAFPGVKQLILDDRNVRGIAATRQSIWDRHRGNGVQWVCMVSDDVRFARRDADMKLHMATEETVLHILDSLYRLLAHGWLHVGLSARSGNNRQPLGVKAIGRMCDVYAHDVQECHRLGVRWDRVEVMEDFDVTLQLLGLGHPNAIIYDHCWDQGSSNADGGCSTYRTWDMQDGNARKLQELHPDFVTVVTKESNNWQGFDTRTDVRVGWLKAFRSWKGLQGATPDQAQRARTAGFVGTPMVKKPLRKKVLRKKKLLRRKFDG